MDWNEIFAMAVMVVGGFGLFLLGMKNMSEGMQAIAGHRLRKALNAIAGNRLMACGVGITITCMIQSSSITTVMSVGMVNAGLMTLNQAIGVILGANIGTTITGWILAVKVAQYGLPILGVSALFFLFSKRDKVRYTAMLFLGLGMVFYGLQLMRSGFEPLGQMEAFETWFRRFSPETYVGLLQSVAVGAILTAIVQSSSATLGITMGLAGTGLIDFPTAAALILGENIGTTITAYLASLGGSTNAKRASYAHIFVNVIGVIWITSIFPYYLDFLRWILRVNPDLMVMVDGRETFPYILPAIAMSHTAFNVANVLLFLPLVGILARFLHWYIPDKKIKETPHLRYIDIRMLNTPAIGIEQSMKEIIFMGRGVDKMMFRLRQLLFDPDPSPESERKIFQREETLDTILKEVIEFLSNLLSGNISRDVMENGRRQLRMADEYESISDYITSVLKFNIKLRKENLETTEEGKEEIFELHDKVTEYIKFINQAVEEEDRSILGKARIRGDEITHMVKEFRSRHLLRVEAGKARPLKSMIFTEMLSAYRRIKDHALNIAEVNCGEK